MNKELVIVKMQKKSWGGGGRGSGEGRGGVRVDVNKELRL